METSNSLYIIFWLTIYFLVFNAFILGLVSITIKKIRTKRETELEKHVTFLKVRMPPNNEIEISAAEHLFSGLMGFKKPFFKALLYGQYKLSFEIVSKKDGIGFYVVTPNDLLTLVEKQINGAYPSAEIDIIDPSEIWDRGAYTSVAEFRLAGAPFYPIKIYEDVPSDPLNLITSSMSKLSEHEVLAVQYIIRPASENWRRAGSSYVSNVRRKSSHPDKGYAVDTSLLEGVEKKTSKPGFDVSIRVVSISDSKQNAEMHLRNMFSSFEQFTDVRFNRFVYKHVISIKGLVHSFIHRHLYVKEWFIPIFNIMLYKNTSILNVEELATVFHFPNKNVETPNIDWLGARRAAAPANIPQSGVYLGVSSFRNTETQVYIREEDRRRHMYVIGQTGTGKSQFLKALALQDIKNGKGLAIIDPHGSDIQEIMERVPKERLDDVIYFNAADTERPLGINILEAKSEEEKNMVINAFIALLYKLYDPNRQGIMGPQLERSIRNVMLTAMVDPESTLVDVLRMLIDEEYHKKFLPKVTDPLVKRYWIDEVANTSKNRKGEMMGYIVSKFDRFITERTMRNILGQPKSAFNFDQVMAENKILLVDLSKGKIGEENSTFLGLVLVPRILIAALRRASLMEKGVDFPDFYLYVDEFQNFATPDFATILSEARKYKLNLIVAHQFVAQLPDEIKTAIFGNVGTMTVFRVGNDDSEYLESQFEPIFTANDLINLPMGNCYTRLLIKGQPSRPFSMQIPWDETIQDVSLKYSDVPKDPKVAEAIRETSRRKYGRDATEIEALISERAGITDELEQDSAQMPPRKSILPF